VSAAKVLVYPTILFFCKVYDRTTLKIRKPALLTVPQLVYTSSLCMWNFCCKCVNSCRW